MPRKNRWWVYSKNNLVALTGAGAVVDLLADYKTEVGINEARGITVAAIYGSVAIQAETDAVDTLLHDTICAIGVLDGAAANVTSNPIPGADSFNWMWIWGRPWHLRFREHSAGVFITEPASWIDFEVHSMRKVGMNQFLEFKAFNSSPMTVKISVNANILLLK